MLFSLRLHDIVKSFLHLGCIPLQPSPLQYCVGLTNFNWLNLQRAWIACFSVVGICGIEQSSRFSKKNPAGSDKITVD